MKASLYRVVSPEQASFRCVRVREQKLGVPWHFHPEYQLTLVLRGSGQRIVGDSIAPVQPGDLTLLGPNVPHFWDVDGRSGAAEPHGGGRRIRRVDAIVVQFRAEFLGREFWGIPETAAVVSLLKASARGLTFSIATRMGVAADIRRLPQLAGLQRLLGLISVLDGLAGKGRSFPICSGDYAPRLDVDDRDRLAPVLRRIHEQLAEPVRRQELAALAGVSERSFSRYFRRKIGKTLPQFVNELRVGRARRMLAETDLTVTQIAQECGFRNLSNFNSQFRTIAGDTPQKLRLSRSGSDVGKNVGKNVEENVDWASQMSRLR
jgi:AraC-like DNA-binding protein